MSKTVEQAREDNKRANNAILIHKHVRQNPETKPDICEKLGISERDFDNALRFSRKNVDSSGAVVNEIVGVTNAPPYLYYAAKTVEQADAYISQRAKIADGHLKSVELLLEKELAKFPAKTREISLNLTAVKRMREDMVYLLAD